MGGEWDKCFKKTWAPLANVVEDVRKIGKDLTKQDHIVTVGGAGNSLDINQDCLIDKDLLRRYDKLWMKGGVRSVNLQLDKTLMRHDMSHINVTDTGTIVREEYILTHGLHLNSRGKVRFTHLIAESIHGGHVPSRNSGIHVITHARACPFLG
jgi:hypothetical protein